MEELVLAQVGVLHVVEVEEYVLSVAVAHEEPVVVTFIEELESSRDLYSVNGLVRDWLLLGINSHHRIIALRLWILDRVGLAHADEIVHFYEGAARSVRSDRARHLARHLVVALVALGSLTGVRIDIVGNVSLRVWLGHSPGVRRHLDHWLR